MNLKHSLKFWVLIGTPNDSKVIKYVKSFPPTKRSVLNGLAKLLDPLWVIKSI